MLNKKFKRLSATILLIFSAIIFHANDVFAQSQCDNFPVTTCNIPSSFQVWSLQDSTVMTTGQAGEPRIIPNDTTLVNSTWYSWTAPANANYILDTRGTNPNGATNFDVMIAVYTGNGSFANLTLVARNDDWISTQFPNNCVGTVSNGTEWVGSSCLKFSAVAGTTYQFQVEGWINAVGAFFLNLSLTPTSAEISISGRALDADGNPLSRVRVNLTKPSGEVLTAVTNSFGYYDFEGLDTGQTYVLEAQSKKYLFQNNPRVLSVSDDVQNEDFIAADSFFNQRE